MAKKNTAEGTRESPWSLKTPPGSAEFQAFRDESLEPPALVVRVGKTELRYDLRCIEDLHRMLKSHGDWRRSASPSSSISRRTTASARERGPARGARAGLRRRSRHARKKR